ncbi:MAG TPA: bifunctional 4-hydroxy-2-oxoglutarate aldolase/2-dehydro-3-deoxy-phosphogluconate aldolase [Polyangiaceae bacterium]|nr:bifunctional 4-hydroxy-2-oxoglutarate aldolase/2-dehydro-3-deoxy-phosphogluconate aldolase [Polyangiaceae bacterium]
MTASRDAEVARRIADIGVVPVVRVRSTDAAYRAADALLEGGISTLEITLTVPNAIAAIRSLATRIGDRALIGAGTVLSPADVDACVDAGAQFIVSPGLDAATMEAARRCDVLAVPGALTPTEIMAATRWGSSLVKIFPCSAMGGPTYLRALRGPLPHVQLLPTGGITMANAVDYIAAGAAAVGMGSELVDERLLETGQGAVLTERARTLVRSIRSARAGVAAVTRGSS